MAGAIPLLTCMLSLLGLMSKACQLEYQSLSMISQGSNCLLTETFVEWSFICVLQECGVNMLSELLVRVEDGCDMNC